jgi:uncharacterized protein YkwD
LLNIGKKDQQNNFDGSIFRFNFFPASPLAMSQRFKRCSCTFIILKRKFMRLNSLFVLFLTSFVLHGQAQTAKSIYTDSAFISALLQQHNTYRSALQLPDLVWSPALARDALAWARHLASTGRGQHDVSIRGREGENLWWGTADAYSYTDMVAMWGNEKNNFVYGVFPNVGTSSSAVVGHYTQIVWKNTTSVGCALAGNGETDFLVCRYSPPGNVIGQKPY